MSKPNSLHSWWNYEHCLAWPQSAPCLRRAWGNLEATLIQQDNNRTQMQTAKAELVQSILLTQKGNGEKACKMVRQEDSPHKQLLPGLDWEEKMLN